MDKTIEQETSYDLLLLKFVLSAIIDHAHNREQILEYVRANFEAFSIILSPSNDHAFYDERMNELLDLLESGDRKPTLSGKPPALRLVRSTEPDND